MVADTTTPTPSALGVSDKTVGVSGVRGFSGVRECVRGTGVCPGYKSMSGVQGYVRCPGYEGMSGVRGYVRCPGYEGVSGVRGYVRCPGYEGVSGVRGYVRCPGYGVCPGYESVSGVRGRVRGTRVCSRYESGRWRVQGYTRVLASIDLFV